MTSDNKQVRVFFHWSTEVILITLGGGILILLSAIPMLMSDAPSQILKYSLFSVLVISLLSGLFFAPIYIEVNERRITIKKPISSINIPLDRVMSVKPIKSEDIKGAIRTFGSGGYCGFVGYFSNRRLGNFVMYATERKNLYLVRTTGKSYVISCAGLDGLIRTAGERI